MLTVLPQPPPIKSWALLAQPPLNLFNWPPTIEELTLEDVFEVPPPIKLQAPEAVLLIPPATTA